VGALVGILVGKVLGAVVGTEDGLCVPSIDCTSLALLICMPPSVSISPPWIFRISIMALAAGMATSQTDPVKIESVIPVVRLSVAKAISCTILRSLAFVK
jgi:ribonuclease PH